MRLKRKKHAKANALRKYSEGISYLLWMTITAWAVFLSYTAMVSVSAVVQRRAKILPAAFQHLFHEFNEAFSQTNFFHGYRLLAVDGSDIYIPNIPDDYGTHYCANDLSKGYNLMHIQREVNIMAKTHAPKTVHNAHGLLSSVLKTYRPDFALATKLPPKQPRKPYVPSDDDINRLIQGVKGTELCKAILLAAFGSFRRSEIDAFTADDIDIDWNCQEKCSQRIPQICNRQVSGGMVSQPG